MRNTPQQRALSELAPVSRACPGCWAHRRLWRPWAWLVPNTAPRVCVQLWKAQEAHWESGPVPGFRQGARGRPFTREHWGASVYALYVSQLSLELWQSLALPGLFCALDPKLITEGTVPLLTYLIWKLLSNGHFILVAIDITPRQFWGSHFSCDWIELWSLEQKAAIQMWIDVSSNMQMFFGRLMNILNLFQEVKRVELEIEKIRWQEKSVFHFSLNLPFLKIIKQKPRTRIQILDLWYALHLLLHLGIVTLTLMYWTSVSQSHFFK